MKKKALETPKKKTVVKASVPLGRSKHKIIHEKGVKGATTLPEREAPTFQKSGWKLSHSTFGKSYVAPATHITLWW